MENFNKIIKNLAFIYALIVVAQATLIPNNVFGYLDNLFFPFALIYFVQLIFEKKSLFVFVLPMLILFGWSIIVQLLKNTENFTTHLSYCLLFLKYSILLMIGHSIIADKRSKFFFVSFLDLTFIILVGINLLMVLNPFGWGEQIQYLYTNSDYITFSYYHQYDAYRLSGTQNNPNDNVIIWLCFLVYYLIRKDENWIKVILAMLMILFTQSRTAFIALILILSIQVILLLVKRFNWRMFFVIIGSMITAVVLVILSSTYLHSLFTGNAFSSKSLLTRIGNFEKLKASRIDDLVIGNGVITNPETTLGYFFDSEYLGIILQFGLVGLTCWVLFSVVALWRYRSNSMVNILIVVWIISTTNFVFINPVLGGLVALFIGFFASEKENELIKLDTSPMQDIT